MNCLGLIPARAGSQGIPRKNIRPLAGVPLISYACRAARKCAQLDRVVCSTDSDEIASIVREEGVEVPFTRPRELATNEALIVDVLEHALRTLQERGDRYEYCCLLQPTSPFVSAETIGRALDLAVRRDADTVVSGYACGQRHPSTIFSFGVDHKVVWLQPGSSERMMRRQDLSNYFFRAGTVYVFRSRVILENRTLYGERIYGIEVPSKEAISIDTEVDWALAEHWLAMEFQ